MMTKIIKLFESLNSKKAISDASQKEDCDKCKTQDLRSVEIELHALDHLIHQHLYPPKHIPQKFSDHEKDH